MKYFLLLSLVVSQSAVSENTTWKQEIEQWKTERVKALKRPHGWLSLIGMEWFHNGKNSIGSAKENAIILPHGPAHIGTFILKKDKITFKPIKGVSITANNEAINESIPVEMDSSGEPTIFKIDSFLFYVIERGKPALRIKDSEALTRANFKGIDYFPVSEKFKVKAKFVAYEPVKEIEIINVLGLLSKEKSLGKLEFSIDNNNYALDVLDAGDEYYLIFADKTSGRSTYGPGRFLYVPKANANNITSIDFNKAYNPPCAFTDYSTCPLPPPQNRIPVYIEAGEKKYNK